MKMLLDVNIIDNTCFTLIKNAYNYYKNNIINIVTGTFVECIKSSNYDANKLVELLFNEFESYRDEAIYKDIKGNYTYILIIILQRNLRIVRTVISNNKKLF